MYTTLYERKKCVEMKHPFICLRNPAPNIFLRAFYQDEKYYNSGRHKIILVFRGKESYPGLTIRGSLFYNRNIFIINFSLYIFTTYQTVRALNITEGKMKAEVVIVNYVDNRFVALTDDSEYIIFTLKNGHDIDLGDFISGNYINPASSSSYYNHTQNQAFRADFNNVCLNFKQALNNCMC